MNGRGGAAASELCVAAYDSRHRRVSLFDDQSFSNDLRMFAA